MGVVMTFIQRVITSSDEVVVIFIIHYMSLNNHMLILLIRDIDDKIDTLKPHELIIENNIFDEIGISTDGHIFRKNLKRVINHRINLHT